MRAAAPTERGGWRYWPAAAALAVWLALAGLVAVPAAQAPARAVCGWMLEPLFHDWHVVQAGWAWQAAGADPLADPRHPFNYPRTVLAAAALGRWVAPDAAGLALAAATLGSLVWLWRPRSRAEALGATALMISPPVLLLAERGNLDGGVLALTVAGIALATRPGGGEWGRVAASAAGVAAAALKLFPAAILATEAAAQRGRRRWLALAAAGVFAGWLVATLGDVGLVMQKTTRGYEGAYGRIVAASRWQAEQAARGGRGAPEAGALLRASTLVAAGLALAAVAAGWRGRRRFAAVAATERERLLFRAGAAVYAGTFLLGHNWNYRLVFLAMTLPWLVRAAEQAASRRGAAAVLAATAIVLWSPGQLPLGWFLGREAAAWLLAGAMIAGVTASAAAEGRGACAARAAG